MSTTEKDPRASEPTTAGNYFISNYPPYAYWRPEKAGEALAALDRPGDPATPLGLYVHLPFCRKRCDFCYFKVYTDKNSAEIRRYLDALMRELELYLGRAFLAGRRPTFVYFGGGTPSYLSTAQLEELFDGLRRRLSWDRAEEVAFECEPGTLGETKVHALKRLGVTRLSLGIENFDAEILELNNRAHRAKEIDEAWSHARAAGFDQVNIDLIAGMIGESEENWRRCIERTIELGPESVTIYQMEVPYNTTIYQRMKDGSSAAAPVADWDTKRRWVAEAFERLERAGYRVSSAYTMVRGERARFLYRDLLWHGADLLSLGVSSFSHVAGTHLQNESSFGAYLERVEAGEPPIQRAYVLSPDERFLRELVLQMKLGRIDLGYFRRKFGVEVKLRFADTLARYAAEGLIRIDGDELCTTREGLLRVDRLLPELFLPEHRGTRYV